MEDPHIAAHQVAKHLRAIAALLPRLSAQAADPLYDLLNREALHAGGVDCYTALENAAVTIEATAPFEPVQAVQAEIKDAMRAFFAEQLADRSTREVVDDYCGDWTEAEWRAEYEEMSDCDEALGDDPLGDWHGRNE